MPTSSRLKNIDLRKEQTTMKDNEKKVKATEEVKEEVQTEEKGVQLTDEELAQVSGGGKVWPVIVV